MISGVGHGNTFIIKLSFTLAWGKQAAELH